MVRTVVVAVRSLRAARGRRERARWRGWRLCIHSLDLVYFPPLVLIRLVVVMLALLPGWSVRIDSKGSNRTLPARTRVQG
jgi:hypothetical protein